MINKTANARTARIDGTMDGAVILLTPLDRATRRLFASILAGIPGTADWHSQGSEYERPDKRMVTGTSYACGGERYKRVDHNCTTTDYRGAIKVRFDLTTVSDDRARWAMRDYGYFCGITMDADSTADCLRLRAAKACKVCGMPLTRFMELEWKVCDICSAICQHKYIEGVGQDGGRLVYLPFCEICGRGDPEWQPSEDPWEDTIKVVTEGAVDILFIDHLDGTSTTISKRTPAISNT